MQAILRQADIYLREKLEALVVNQEDRFGVDLSVSAFMNGIISDELPEDTAWQKAYKSDSSTQAMIAMLHDPSKITTESLLNVHSTFRPPMRDSQIKWIENRLYFQEPIAHSTKSIRLVIVPNDLQHHIFASFHVNPLGGHYSLYYMLHRIRLRYLWSGMYTWLKKRIATCAACMLRDGVSRPALELLYSFPIDAPMNTVHADVWVPGKTVGYDGNTALIIVLCHMTGFVAVEPLKELNSTTFTQSIYTILLRYGMIKLLRVRHHPVARGHHDAIFVERFNRFLNAGLRVFNNDRGINRVFIEGALTLCYAWNSCPVTSTDLSRSLLVVGKEFQFPIDFTSRYHVTYDLEVETIKSYSEDLLCDLLMKCRETYTLLISEHRAMHHEYRNAQINHGRKFNTGNIVFTNVQVQRKRSSGTVAKLAYICRGPYKVVQEFKS
eukprot:scaffold5516_cov32-Attheya_sp.AAC.2